MKLTSTAPPLRVEHLALAARDILIQFVLEEGSILAVLGENGSGKSLFLSCLAGYRWSPGATVEVHGFNIFDRRERSAAQRLIGVVFQNSGLIRNLTVFENVALPFLARSLNLDSELKDKVKLRLDLVGCGHLLDRTVTELSEGDRKCIALARALAGEARILVADEPFAALSPKRRSLVEELLVRLVDAGALSGVVFATQDLALADRIASHFLIMASSGGRPTGRAELQSAGAGNGVDSRNEPVPILRTILHSAGVPR
jgi:ABC-type sulfate/molybdate transport systems ATPase subunit